MNLHKILWDGRQSGRRLCDKRILNLKGKPLESEFALLEGPNKDAEHLAHVLETRRTDGQLLVCRVIGKRPADCFLPGSWLCSGAGSRREARVHIGHDARLQGRPAGVRHRIAAERSCRGTDKRWVNRIVERLRIHLVAVSNGEMADRVRSIELRGPRRRATPTSKRRANYGAARGIHRNNMRAENSRHAGRRKRQRERIRCHDSSGERTYV